MTPTLCNTFLRYEKLRGEMLRRRNSADRRRNSAERPCNTKVIYNPNPKPKLSPEVAVEELRKEILRRRDAENNARQTRMGARPLFSTEEYLFFAFWGVVYTFIGVGLAWLRGDL